MIIIVIIVVAVVVAVVVVVGCLCPDLPERNPEYTDQASSRRVYHISKSLTNPSL